METNQSPSRRLGAIDAVRGTVMVLMALDHVRDFVHRDAMSYSPTDLELKTDRVGYVVYEDEYQVVAEPFADVKY